MRANNGAPGADKTTLVEVEQYGIERLLDELAAQLREGAYRPLPLRENRMYGLTGGSWKRNQIDHG
ncbi:hypothetical protein P3H15_47030 [Rhodococcus sp. T2V]|nr:hypothetical protein [Rhodococcus sp. T2V]